MPDVLMPFWIPEIHPIPRTRYLPQTPLHCIPRTARLSAFVPARCAKWCSPDQRLPRVYIIVGSVRGSQVGVSIGKTSDQVHLGRELGALLRKTPESQSSEAAYLQTRPRTSVVNSITLSLYPSPTIPSFRTPCTTEPIPNPARLSGWRPTSPSSAYAPSPRIRRRFRTPCRYISRSA